MFDREALGSEAHHPCPRPPSTQTLLNKFLLDPTCFGTLADGRAKHTEVLSIRAELEASSPVLALCVRPQPHLPVIP